MTERTLDRIPTPDHLKLQDNHLSNFLLVAYPSQYDKIIEAKLSALTARVAVLEGKLPVPPAPVPPSGRVVWDITVSLDQEAEGECVGHGWAHFIAASPNPNPIVGTQVKSNPTAEHLYERAQVFDGATPDEQSGASVGGGAKAAAELGTIVSSHWSSNLLDIKNTILNHGPVVMGTDWYHSMMTPDANGQVHVSGSVAGGHCYLIIGYEAATDLYLIHNSWGSGWGHNGDATISGTDLASLLASQGEAWFAVKK